MQVYMIGAGGVASYLINHLKRIFKDDLYVYIQDKDILEERNLDRQVFDKKYVGMNKAAALLKTNKVKGKVIDSWFMNGTVIPAGVNVIICVADNNPCREAALEKSDQTGIPLIIAANETFYQQAYIYFRQWKDTKADPRVRYKEIITDESDNPIRCTDEVVVSTSPQTSVANAGAAQHAFHLLWLWLSSQSGITPRPDPVGKDDNSMYAPFELDTVEFRVNYLNRAQAKVVFDA